MPTHTVQPLDVANRLRPVLVKLARELRRELRDLGVTAGQVSLLWEIERTPGIGVRELAAREGVSAPAMSGHVDRLEAAGLVTRTRSADDRRRVGLAVTGQGRRVLRAVKTRRTHWLASRLRSLDGAQLEAVDRAIDPLAQLLAEDA